MSSSKKSGGFTLLELMITLAVMAILLSIAVPSYQNTTKRQQTRNVAENLHITLLYARSEAIKRNRPVSVRSSSGDAADWDAGWDVVPLDDAGNVETDAGGNDIQLRVEAAQDGVVAEENNGLTSITFNRSGRTTAAVEFSVCSAGGGDVERVVSVSITGMAQVERGGTCP